MLDLDFAFFKLNNSEKRGLFYQKNFLNWLGPVFFLPRVEKLIQLNDLNFSGCQISMPLSPGHLSLIEPEKQQTMFKRCIEIAQDYQLPSLAVDRCLKKQLLEFALGFPLIFGDNFIKALAAAIITRVISQREITRIIMVGEVEHYPEFISGIGQCGVPLSIQTRYPAQYEVMVYRLLYEKGYAVSTSLLNPHSWEAGDLVLVFEPQQESLAVTFPQTCCIQLTNNAYGLAPELEAKLVQNGIESSLHNLAPIMETCMLGEAGILSSGGEQIMINEADGREGSIFLTLQQIGDELGLWDLFLDKGI